METKIYATIDQDNFFPTPENLAEKMLEPVNFKKVQSILEPEAGKGDLVDSIMRKLIKTREWHIDCVEIDPGLQSILRYRFSEKGIREYHKNLYEEYENFDKNRAKAYENDESRHRYWYLRDLLDVFEESGNVRVMDNDFLSFNPPYQYDLVVMNPPFSKGAEHLVHAIELVEVYGGQICCLLNAETIRNPYTNIRKLLAALLERHDATINFVENAFQDAERKTNVEVAIIYLNIAKPRHESKIFSKLQKAEERKKAENPEYSELISSDPVEAIISMYNAEITAGLKLIEEYEALSPHLNCTFSSESGCNLSLSLYNSSYSGRPEKATPNGYIRLVREKYWTALFQNEKITGLMTSNLREKYSNMVKDLVNYEFNEFNISWIRTEMNAEMEKGVKETILNLFEKLTVEHCYNANILNDNIHYYNGWKTNKAYMVNSKCIIPTYGLFANCEWSKDAFNMYNVYKLLSDMEKAFNYLDGGMTREVNLQQQLQIALNAGKTRNIELKYFKVSMYKKGTTHITFTNQELVDRLNIFASQEKGWLPPAYGKKHYKDMDPEEQAVIDSFQGADSYEKIMQNPSRYLFQMDESLLIG